MVGHASRNAVSATQMEHAANASRTMRAGLVRHLVRTAVEYAHKLAVSMVADVGIMDHSVRCRVAASALNLVTLLEGHPMTYATNVMELVLKVAKMDILENDASTGVIPIVKPANR